MREELLARVWEHLSGRVDGPSGFRFLLQPAAAAILAVRAGLRDAANDRPASLWAALAGRVPRVELRIIALALGVAAMAGPVTAIGPSITKYRITAKYDHHTDFRTLHSYAWTVGWASFDPALDAHIVRAIDRELAARGFSRQEAGGCDVLIAYRSLQRSDVDVHGPRAGQQMYPEYPVGTLMIVMLEPRTKRELFRARVDMPVEIERPGLEEQIDSLVTRMFERYPTKRGDP